MASSSTSRCSSPYQTSSSAFLQLDSAFSAPYSYVTAMSLQTQCSRHNTTTALRIGLMLLYPLFIIVAICWSRAFLLHSVVRCWRLWHCIGLYQEILGGKHKHHQTFLCATTSSVQPVLPSCDAHDARVSVLHEVCVCRLAVLHVTCVYVLFRGSVCARVDHVLMYDGVVPRHCAYRTPK